MSAKVGFRYEDYLWTCQVEACRHHGKLEDWYDREEKTYACPSCGVFPEIPHITITNPKTKASEVFFMPTPKQVEAMLSPVRNLLYGGRAGTGKSWWLRMEAYHRCMSNKGFRALILRRDAVQLMGTHLDKAALEAPQIGAVWRASEKTVVFSNGSRLRFGHCNNDQEVSQYLSEEFDWIGFDEGATFTEYQVKFISSRLRTSRKGATPRLRIGSNPGAMWIHAHFIKKQVDRERYPAYNPDHYHFIPASADDNSYVSKEEYELRLNELPTEALRKMYRDGLWDAVEGQMFTEWSPTKILETPEGKAKIVPWHEITELPKVFDGAKGWVPITEVPWVSWSRVLDWGYSPDPGVVIWFAHLPSGRYIAVQEWVFRETLMKDVAAGVIQRSRGLKLRKSIAGHDLWMKSTDTGIALAETSAKHGVSWTCATTDRIQGWQALHGLLKETVDEGNGPVPRLQVYIGGDDGPGCPTLAQSLPMLQNDPKNPGDCLQKDDHAPDTARWFAIDRPTAAKPPTASAWSRLSATARARLLGGERSYLGSESVRRR